MTFLVDELKSYWSSAKESFPAGDQMGIDGLLHKIFCAGFISAIATMQKRLNGHPGMEEILSIHDILELAKYMTETKEKPK